ncbi:MAG: DUF1850 domain-containing protein [Desulfobacteraceae bacterium]|nr:MAG: DUF1850 domain-containing protein [Desulfobacteraceae bacterium]
MPFTSMHLRWVAGVAAVIAVGAGISLWPLPPALEIVDARDGRVLLCARVNSGEEMVLAFVHSVNRRPVYDTLRVEADHLVIVGSRFDAFGAGMPEASTAEGTLRVAADGWLEWTVNHPVPEITVRVGRVADHRLRLRDREIPLSSLAEPGAPLTLRIITCSVLDIMKGRCLP